MKTRIISAIIMLAIIIPAYLLGDIIWAMLVGMVGIMAYKEILDLKESHLNYPPYIKIIGLLCLLLLIYSKFDGYNLAFGVSYGAIAATIFLLLTPSIFLKKYTTKEAFFLIGIILFLGTIFNTFILLENINKLIPVYLIIITIVTDTFAMIIGNLIGRHQLTPISPQKTIEGALGGVIGGTIAASLFYINVINNLHPIQVIIMTITLSIVAQIGDLIFSKIKRENNIKDFSNLIPGHGGILDRLDSIIFTVLFYIIIISIF